MNVGTVQACFEGLNAVLDVLPLFLGPPSNRVLVRGHVTVPLEAVGQRVVLLQVDAIGAVGQVAHAGAASRRCLDCELGVGLRPLLLVVLNERQVILALFQQNRSRSVVGVLHQLGDQADLVLRVLVGTQVEEVVPLGCRDDDLLEQERFEQTVGQALCHVEQELLVDRVVLVVNPIGDVEHEVDDLVVAFLLRP